jgi:hypothetical protein
MEKEIIQDRLNNKGLFKKIADSYFKIRSFEKSGKLYEAFGIDLFRKYCPNGGSKFSLTGSFIDGKSKKDLEEFVSTTKLAEAVHTFILFPYITNSIMNDLSKGDYESVVGGVILNIVGNVYPIMAQRYNRNKANKLLSILDKREKKKLRK